MQNIELDGSYVYHDNVRHMLNDNFDFRIWKADDVTYLIKEGMNEQVKNNFKLVKYTKEKL